MRLLRAERAGFGYITGFVLNSLLSSLPPGRVSQLQDRDNEGRGFIRRSTSYLSSLENPTDARSMVCDAKEDALASYQRLPGI